MSAKTPVVDKIAFRFSGDTPIGQEEAIRQYNDLLDLARALESHCEAMRAELSAQWIPPKACTEYVAWKREQLGK